MKWLKAKQDQDNVKWIVIYEHPYNYNKDPLESGNQKNDHFPDLTKSFELEICVKKKDNRLRKA